VHHEQREVDPPRQIAGQCGVPDVVPPHGQALGLSLFQAAASDHRPADITLEDLRDAVLSGFEDTERVVVGLQALGLPVTLANFPIRTEDHLVQWELCKQSLGVCIVMEEVGEVEPAVRQVLPALPQRCPSTW
jgi:hypothetical protein